MIKIIFRDLNPEVVTAVKKAIPEWDTACSDIFSAGPADFLISPGNVTGNMDGGIDLVYVKRFGWQIHDRLMGEIKRNHGGILPIGKARVITTYDKEIPLLICAPTMNWPPHVVSHTQNASLAFAAALDAADSLAIEHRNYTVLMPGLGTLTGRMSPETFANQVALVWAEYKSKKQTGGILTSDLIGADLDYWTAKALGATNPGIINDYSRRYCVWNKGEGNQLWDPSTNPKQGWMIIDSDRISVYSPHKDAPPGRLWQATLNHSYEWGSTSLVAAMRCKVASVYGNTVE